VAIQRFDGCIGHGFLGVGHEAEASVYTGIIGQDDAIGHVAVAFEQVPQFLGPNFTGQAANEEAGSGSSALLASSATAGLAFKSEVTALATVLTNIGSNEGGTPGGPFCEHGFSGSAPPFARIVQGACTLVKIGPSGTVVVGERSVGLVTAGRALHVPVSVEFGLKGVAARWAKGVKNATIVSFSEI